MKARTGRVKDQVAVTQTRQALSSSLQGACLTERRGERKMERQRVQGSEKENMTDIKKKERRGGEVSKQAL